MTGTEITPTLGQADAERLTDRIRRGINDELQSMFFGDEIAYAGLDEKTTTYLKARVKDKPSLLPLLRQAAHMRSAKPSRPPRRPSIWIYFIQQTPGGQIKIGTAVNVATRLSTLQTASASILQVLAVMPGGTTEEQALHRRFGHARIRGEWFTPTPDVLAFIEEVS